MSHAILGPTYIKKKFFFVDVYLKFRFNYTFGILFAKSGNPTSAKHSDLWWPDTAVMPCGRVTARPVLFGTFWKVGC